MNCGHCGAPNPEGSGVEFCGSCGARLSPRAGQPLGSRQTPIPRSLRAMNLGDMLDETIRLYRQNFRTFIGIAAVLQIPIALLRMVQLAFAGPALFSLSSLTGAAPIQAEDIIFFNFSSLILTLIGVIAFLLIEAALASAISQRFLGHQVTVGEAYRVALACFWQMFRASVLVIIILGLLFITIIGIPFAIFFGIRYSLIVQALVLEGKGARDSLSRSSNLVKGSWWRVLGILLVAGIIQYMVAALPVGVIGGALGLTGALAFPALLSVFVIIATALGSLFEILAAPFTPTVSTLLYYDLRIRKEGYDLEVMASQPAEA